MGKQLKISNNQAIDLTNASGLFKVGEREENKVA